MLKRSTISAAVNTAFAAAGELVETVTLTSEEVSGFNFATGLTLGNSSVATIEVLPYKTEKNERGSFITEMLVRASDLPLSTYSHLTTADFTNYRIESLEAYEGIVIMKVRHPDA